MNTIKWLLEGLTIYIIVGSCRFNILIVYLFNTKILLD